MSKDRLFACKNCGVVIANIGDSYIDIHYSQSTLGGDIPDENIIVGGACPGCGEREPTVTKLNL